MAAQATNIELHSTGFAARILHILQSMGQAFLSIGEAASRSREIQAYQSLSDEELAKRGLKRDEIVQHVFRDKMFI